MDHGGSLDYKEFAAAVFPDSVQGNSAMQKKPHIEPQT